MPQPAKTAVQRRPFLDRLVSGEPAASVAKAAGVNPTTLYRWAKKDEVDLSARHGAQPEKAATATEGARRAWAGRKATMADEIGEAAQKALTVCAYMLDVEDVRKAKDAALTLAILVDKAQLLSGAETSRNGVTADPHSLLEAGRARVAHLRPVRDA